MNKIKWHYKLFVLAIMIALIPAIFISINMINITETQLTSNVNDELINASQLLTHDIDQFFAELEDKLSLIGNSTESDDLGANEKVSLLVSSVEEIDEIISIRLLFQNSENDFDIALTVIKEIFANDQALENLSQEIFNNIKKDALQNLLNNKRSLIFEASYIKEADKWIVPVLTEVKIDGAPSAVLFTVVDIYDIGKRLEENPILSTGNMYIVNKEKKFVFNNPFTTDSGNTVLNDAVEMLNNISRMQAVNNYERDGKNIVTSISFPERINWAVISEMNEDIAYLTVSEMNNVLLIWLFVGIGIAFIAVLMFTQSVSKPINYLAEKARLISNGDFDISTSYKANDSIGLLGNTLVSMSKSLKSSFKKIEAQNKELEEYNKTLEDKVKQRTIELKNTNDQLQEAYLKVLELNRDKNEFLGIAAHDLKNPLAAIKGFGEMIIEDEEMNRNYIEDFAKSIVDSSERMFDIITNLLDVNKIEEGKIDVRYESTDLENIIGKIIIPNKENADRKNIQLIYNSNLEGEKIETDKNLISQIVDNLVSNAIKFSPNNKKVYIDILNEESTVSVQIRDEGPGLSDEDKKGLFKKFAKLSARPTAGENSTGLGLSIVKKISEMIGAEITVESTIGKGASFKLVLPKE
jgi:signal transduction histidine kinase